MAVILECRSLKFKYGEKQILENISFQVEQGSFCAILGKNGTGKTTLLHCLNRILTPCSGDIIVDSHPIETLGQRQIARLISLVPQEHIEIFPFRVIDVVVMGRAPFIGHTKTPGEQDLTAAMKALNDLNARHLAEKNFNRISGGQRQIVLLAMALAQASKIMLLDEPTNHLDFNNQYHLLSIIKNLCKTKGLSIIASMHDPNMAMLFADEVVMIKDSAILAKGPAKTIMTQENISRLYDTRTFSIKLDKDRLFFLPEEILSDQSQP